MLSFAYVRQKFEVPESCTLYDWYKIQCNLIFCFSSVSQKFYFIMIGYGTRVILHAAHFNQFG
jgi:hypothetical protein